MGFGKEEATKEELPTIISATAEGSITHNNVEDEIEEAIDTRDEDKSGTEKSDDFVQPSEVQFSKSVLLQFRAFVDEQGEVARMMPFASAMANPTREFDGSTGSPKSTSKSIDTASSRSDALTPTAGSWTAAMQIKRSMVDTETVDDEKITRKACSILNKLTVEKFDSLFEQLATCGIRKPEHLEMLMCEVFNKATTQHHFIPMYADLCVRLEQDSRICSVVEAAGQQHSFRRLLLNQCQLSFEKLLQPGEIQEASKSKDADFDDFAGEYALKRKQQALGNIKLIGQLLVHGIVNSRLLVECSEELLHSRGTCPEALESLAALLTVAGKQFDTKNYPYHPQLLDVFSSMRKLSKDKSTQARVRFLLRDVLDVRDAGWSHCTYKATLATAPMKLDEVRESAAHEGKYISLEDQIETDSLLAGLLSISKLANAKKENTPTSCQSASTESTPMNKFGRHHQSRRKVNFPKDAVPDAAYSELPCDEKKAAGCGDISTASQRRPHTEIFDVVSFRRALASILADLASDRNVPAAVRRIRVQEVPAEFQAKEFADIITRIVEERRGPLRRCAFSFVAGLAAPEKSAFDRDACLDGIGHFFREVYPQLCIEIPRLPAIATSELLPTLANVFPKDDLIRRLPEGMDFQIALK